MAVVYFGGCATAGARSRLRVRGWLYTAGAIALVIVARFAWPWEVRAWLPHAYLVLGYWIPAAFTPAPIDRRFENWLRRADEKLGRWGLGVGNWHHHLMELAYLLCYPLVPAAFLVVVVLGREADIHRFWLAVLAAGYACYGTLPWTAARPPRLSGGSEGRPATPIAALNVAVLGRVSHNLNTFPSGHVAVAIAAGLAVWPVSAAWGAAVLALAVTIAVAAVAGRYHYGVDVLAGVGVGAAAATIAGVAVAVPGRPCG